MLDQFAADYNPTVSATSTHIYSWDATNPLTGAIGIATPGSCVSDDNGQLEENEGVNPVLNDPDAIFPYSIGKYIAEKFHSALCITKSTCAPNASGIICTHTPGKNLFGCDTHGTMALKEISGVAPTTGTGASTVINGSFPATFQRTVFEVVPFDPNTTDHIPGATSPVGSMRKPCSAPPASPAAAPRRRRT